MSGDTGMSSELQAIMQRRLAKLKSSEKINVSNPGPSSKINDVNTKEGLNDGIEHIGMKRPDKALAQREIPNVFSKLKESESESLGYAARAASSQEGNATKSPEKDSDQQQSKFSDFKQTIARFNKMKNLPAINNVSRNIRTSPVEARRYSPIPFVEQPKAPHSDSKISFSSNVIKVKPYALRPSSAKKMPNQWAGNIHATKRNANEQDVVAKAKNANENRVPKVVMTHPPPPPPPTNPPPKSSPRNDELRKSPSFLDRSKKHALPSSHVQAMKLKFLLKNPDPQTVASLSTINPVLPLSGSHHDSSTSNIVKDDKTEVSRSQRVDEIEEDNGLKEAIKYSELEVKDLELEVKQDESRLPERTVEKPAPLFATFNDKEMSHASNPENESNQIEDSTPTFGAIFGQEAMNVDIDVNIDDRAQDQALFGNFDPSVGSKETNVEAATTSQGALWNWNGDPFSSQNPVKIENNLSQVDAVDQEFLKETDVEGDDGEAYVPPPLFKFVDFGSAAPFVPENDDFEDDDDRETLMDAHEGVAELSAIAIQRTDILTFPKAGDDRSFSCQNPLTKNVILCHRRGKTWVIDEIDTLSAPTVVCTTEISCADIQRKLDSVIVCGVKDVTGITSGLHYQNGQAKVSIGVILSLHAFGANGPLEMVAVWRWGYDKWRLNGIGVVLPSPPPRFTYDPTTLSSADGLFFIAGTLESKATILVSKPYENNEWISSFLTTESDDTTDPGKIVSMELCPARKVVAISGERGAISVWSYSEFIIQSGQLSEGTRLKLVCILEGASALDRAPRSMCLSTLCELDEVPPEDESENEDKKEVSTNPRKISDTRCHCLAWLPTESSSSPLLLAVAFMTGIAVYALSLPDIAASTDQIIINPFVATKFDGDEVGSGKSTVVWMKGGNGVFPYLAAILFRNEKQMVISVAEICFPSHAEDNKSAYLNVVTEESYPVSKAKLYKFYGQNLSGSVLAHYHGCLTSFCLGLTIGNSSNSELHPKLSLDSLPITSEPIGITTTGCIYQPFKDVLYIQNSIEFTNQMGVKVSHRYTLHRASTGDAKGAMREDADMDFPKGGASASFLCDLGYTNSASVSFTPRRIIMDQSGQLCLIFFGEVGKDTTTAFTCLEIPVEENQIIKTFHMYPGKDACFIPGQSSQDEIKILVLDNEAKVLRICGPTNLVTDLETDNCIAHIFKAGSSNDQKLLVNRVFVVSDKVVFLCSRTLDGKQCLFIGGELKSLISRSPKAFVRKKTLKLWLRRFELFVSLVQLPSDTKSEPINIAIATTSQVMIVDPAMKALTQTMAKLSCRGLAPLGSNSVAFIDTSTGGSHLTYLTSWEQNQRGIICNMVGSRPNEAFAILALRPDRVIYLPVQSHCVLSTTRNESVLRDVYRPLTKPVLLFEPLLANALVQERPCGSNNIVLRTILERFGPKRTTNPYSDDEGLGTTGAGISVKAFTMLTTILGPNLRYGEKDKKLAPWIPQNLGKRGLDVLKSQIGPGNLLAEITNNLKEVDAKVADDVWSNIDETKHTWNIGPFEKREELLLLDSIDEWFGKCRPAILGKVGAELAAETGERALQNILAAAAAGGINEDEIIDVEPIESIDGDWIPKIGEGRKDEDNLALYLRFSEGSEGASWRDCGLEDLSFHKNKIELLRPDFISIEETTSNVDEGEPGKVRPLYDIVLNQDEDIDEIGCFMTKVSRGSALDVGMFHSASHISRQRATLEFWFFLPNIPSEIVLVRRAMYDSEMENIVQCSAEERSGLLWELVALPSGHLEFRTRLGTVITSDVTTRKSDSVFEYDPDDNVEMKGQLSLPRENGYGGWNHVSLSFSCKDLAPTQCNVTLRMKGSFIVSDDVSIDIPGLKERDMLDFQAIDNALNTTMLIFCFGGINGLRFTEIRVWACKRASDDIKMMMYEHLDIAKTKKKLKLSIRSKGLRNSTKSGLLMPPRPSDKSKIIMLERPILQLPGTARHLVSEDDASHGMDNASLGESFADFGSIASANDGDDDGSANNPFIAEYMQREDAKMQSLERDDVTRHLSNEVEPMAASSMSSVESSLISTEIRKSAAAAVIRGPPACRHFGGNRGGLSFSHETSNHGNICITGSEKTVIFSPTKSPPGRTYPIGASGAITSDKIDGTEYLCCFLAKEKRIVVFDLRSKVVVVELQMTTKLNYWRFLPPQAHGNTLIFLLVTPMGGFHWMPLEDSPRPKQIWRRGRDLQGKKIVSYEEGGSNGLPDSDAKSSIALILASSTSPDDPVEAWCLSVDGGMKPLCISENLLGAALVNPDYTNMVDAFLPLVAIVSERNAWDKEITLALHSLNVNRDSETMAIEDIIAEVVIGHTRNDHFDIPTMAMGTAPAAFCLTCQEFIAVILRNIGHLIVYKFLNGKLHLVHEKKLERYIVDAAIRAKPGISGIEAVLLACEPNDIKDGRILTITIS